MLKKINISTKKDDIFEITSDVKKIVEESGVKEIGRASCRERVSSPV